MTKSMNEQNETEYMYIEWTKKITYDTVLLLKGRKQKILSNYAVKKKTKKIKF